MKEKLRQMAAELQHQKEKLASLQVSFMHIGNVTMVSVVVGNSQIHNAVDLQRHMSCEMQLNVVVNVHFSVHSSTFRHNRKCISLSEHLYMYCMSLYIYTHMWSVQKVSDFNFSRINKSSTGSVHHSTCGGGIYVHA